MKIKVKSQEVLGSSQSVPCMRMYSAISIPYGMYACVLSILYTARYQCMVYTLANVCLVDSQYTASVQPAYIYIYIASVWLIYFMYICKYVNICIYFLGFDNDLLGLT